MPTTVYSDTIGIMSLGLRHIGRRRKMRSSEFPNRSFVAKEALDIIMYPIALAAPLALLPQVIKIYVTHDIAGLALSTWVILGVLNLAWIFYGRVHKEPPIVLANVVLALLNLAIVVGIILYR